jgi:hypothetical protein
VLHPVMLEPSNSRECKVYTLRAAMLWYQNPVKSPEQIS